jgi:hypothetical protein
MFMSERFLSNLSEGYHKHSVSTDDEIWYQQSLQVFEIRYHINSSYEKSIIDRAIQ